jgi:hypothetical protein
MTVSVLTNPQIDKHSCCWYWASLVRNTLQFSFSFFHIKIRFVGIVVGTSRLLNISGTSKFNIWGSAYTAIAFVLPGVLTLKIACLHPCRFQLKTYAETTKIKVGQLDVPQPYTYKELTPQLQYLSILINALAAAGDVLIAAALCTLLHFSRTGFHK